VKIITQAAWDCKDYFRNLFGSREKPANQRMQDNKMGGQALDEAASTAPILCLILIVRLALE
jgi:hypothetical protein